MLKGTTTGEIEQTKKDTGKNNHLLCFIAYYSLNIGEYKKDFRGKIIASIIKARGKTLFKNIEDMEGSNKSLNLIIYPQIGLTETLERLGNYLHINHKKYYFINFDENSKKSNSAYNALVIFTKRNKEINNENNYIDKVKKFIFSLKSRKHKWVLIDNLEKGILQIYNSRSITLTYANFLRICWIKAINYINSEDNNVHIIVGLFSHKNVQLCGFNLYDEWTDLYEHFQLCFFKEVNTFIRTNNLKISIECEGCGRDPITKQCNWQIIQSEIDKGCEGWQNNTQLKRIVKCCDYNPYWILSPLSEIAKRGRNINFDDYIKDFYTKLDNQNILYNFLRQLPFYLNIDISTDSIEVIKLVVIRWFDKVAKENDNKFAINKWLELIFNDDNALTYLERIKSYNIGINCKESLVNLKLLLKNKLIKLYPNLDYDKIVNAIINALEDSHAVTIQDKKIVSLHPYVAYVYSNQEIYNK